MVNTQEKALISLYSTFIFFMIRYYNGTPLMYFVISYLSMGFKLSRGNLEKTVIGFIIYLISTNIPQKTDIHLNKVLL